MGFLCEARYYFFKPCGRPHSAHLKVSPGTSSGLVCGLQPESLAPPGQAVCSGVCVGGYEVGDGEGRTAESFALLRDGSGCSSLRWGDSQAPPQSERLRGSCRMSGGRGGGSP